MKGELTLNIQYSFKVDRKEIPYYHFIYKNDFKQVLRVRGRRNYWFKDGTYLPEFIKVETLKQHNFSDVYPTFNKVMILFIHRFEDLKQRDLDNYTYKPFIDVIRKLRIVKDDSWKEVSITTVGLLAKDYEKESVEMNIIPFQYYPDFLKQKMIHLFNTESYEVRQMRRKQPKIDSMNKFGKSRNLSPEDEFF